MAEAVGHHDTGRRHGVESIGTRDRRGRRHRRPGEVDERVVELEPWRDGGVAAVGGQRHRAPHGPTASAARRRSTSNQSGTGRVEAEPLELAEGERGESVTAAFVAGERRPCRPRSPTGRPRERDRRRGAGGSGTDDDHIGEQFVGVRVGRHGDRLWPPVRTGADHVRADGRAASILVCDEELNPLRRLLVANVEGGPVAEGGPWAGGVGLGRRGRVGPEGRGGGLTGEWRCRTGRTACGAGRWR